MTSDKIVKLKLKLEKYYDYWSEQTDIMNEIDNRGFFRRIIARINGEYGIAKTLATYYNEEIYLILEELKGD